MNGTESVGNIEENIIKTFTKLEKNWRELVENNNNAVMLQASSENEYYHTSGTITSIAMDIDLYSKNILIEGSRSDGSILNCNINWDNGNYSIEKLELSARENFFWNSNAQAIMNLDWETLESAVGYVFEKEGTFKENQNIFSSLATGDITLSSMSAENGPSNIRQTSYGMAAINSNATFVTGGSMEQWPMSSKGSSVITTQLFNICLFFVLLTKMLLN